MLARLSDTQPVALGIAPPIRGTMAHPTAEPAVSPESPLRTRPRSWGARMLPSTYGPLYTRCILSFAYPQSCTPQAQAHMSSAFVQCADTYLTSYLPLHETVFSLCHAPHLPLPSPGPSSDPAHYPTPSKRSPPSQPRWRDCCKSADQMTSNGALLYMPLATDTRTHQPA